MRKFLKNKGFVCVKRDCFLCAGYTKDVLGAAMTLSPRRDSLKRLTVILDTAFALVCFDAQNVADSALRFLAY